MAPLPINKAASSGCKGAAVALCVLDHGSFVKMISNPWRLVLGYPNRFGVQLPFVVTSTEF
jgi:hypothetical protein